MFLSHLYDQVRPDAEVTSDTVLLQLLNHVHSGAESIGFDAPLSRPICSPCDNPCESFERCKKPHIQWMQDLYLRRKDDKKNQRMFSPYTERAVEQYFNSIFEPDVHVQACLGSNSGPMAARMAYLKQRLSGNLVEVFPRLSVLRLGSRFKIPKRHLLGYRQSMGGAQSRTIILNAFVEKRLIFLYDQDIQKLVDNAGAFDALICAITAQLEWIGDCERRPYDFPKAEGWAAVPSI